MSHLIQRAGQRKQRFFPGGETKAAQILVEVRELQILTGTISHLVRSFSLHF